MVLSPTKDTPLLPVGPYDVQLEGDDRREILRRERDRLRDIASVLPLSITWYRAPVMVPSELFWSVMINL